MSRLSGFPLVSVTQDWASTADDAIATVEVTVPGASLGDFVMVSMDVDLADMILTAAVTAANTVTVLLDNVSTGTVNLASGTLRVRVVPFADA